MPDGALGEVDERWFQEDAQLDLEKRAADYVRQHRPEFLTP